MKHTINGHVEAIIDIVNRHAFTKTTKQTLTLFSSHVFVLIFGIIMHSINTRILGPKDYGIFTFFWTVALFSALFFRFGFFSSGGLLLAHSKNDVDQRKLIGALIIITIIIAACYSFFIFVSSFFIDEIFQTNINGILRVFSLILLVLPFQFLIDQIGQGTNKITILAYLKILPKALYVLIVLSLFRFFSLGIVALILINLLALITTVIIICYSLKPIFNDLKYSLKVIWNKTKEYGFHLYLGQIADQTTWKLDGIFITYFVNTTQLGFYSLSVAIASPMAMLSQSLSVSLFKGFANRDYIPRKVLHLNLLWLIGCVTGLVLLGKFIVVLLFTERFLSVVPFILPLAIAAFFQGLYQPYNFFLAAKGKGQWMRNASIMMSIVNLLGNIVLVPIWGAMGAAIASIFGTLTYFLGTLWYYNKFRLET